MVMASHEFPDWETDEVLYGKYKGYINNLTCSHSNRKIGNGLKTAA